MFVIVVVLTVVVVAVAAEVLTAVLPIVVCLCFYVAMLRACVNTVRIRSTNVP